MDTPNRRAADLRANPKNPRTITPAKRRALAAALEKFGDLGGIVFNQRSNQLVGGHQRVTSFDPNTQVQITKTYDAPTRTGTVAEGFVVVDGERFAYREVSWSPDVEMAANLAANKGAGEFDLGAVSEWMKDLASVDFDLDLTLFDAEERATLGLDGPGSAEGHTQTDEPECKIDVPKRCAYGDIWALGDHRLLCSDSTDKAAIEGMMQGVKADLIFTSPPYDQARDYGAKINDWRILMKGVFEAAPTSEATQILVNLGIVRSKDQEWVPYWHPWLDDMRAMGWRRYNIYIWDQLYGLPGSFGGMLHPQFELIFHLNKALRKPNKTEDVITAGEVASKGFTLKGKDGKRADTTIRNHVIADKKVPGSVLRANRSRTSDTAGHPAPYSVELVTKVAEVYSDPGEVLFEPFSGSGTTIVTGEQIGRRVYGVELEPKYCDIAIDRWARLTGKQPQKVSSGTVTGG